MGPIAINIGDAVSFRKPEHWTVTPDDRQTKHETVGGVLVEDYGHVAAGDVFGCTCVFDEENWQRVKGYWLGRTKVTVVDESGTAWSDMRVVVKSLSYVERFETYYQAAIEFWRC